MRMILALGVACLLAAPALAADPPTRTPMTRDTGAPVGDNQNSKAAGPDGPVLLEDFNLIEKLARFDRERIPERVVHARGTGAQGTFIAAADFPNIRRHLCSPHRARRPLSSCVSRR